MKKIDDLLSQKAKSPTPRLQADPFLATKIAALAAEGEKGVQALAGTQWSVASFATACAVIMGIWLGLGIWENGSTTDSTDIVDEFSGAIYQSGFADDLHASLQMETDR